MAAQESLELYLTFYGYCEEALTSYREIFDGELRYLMRWAELPEEERDPDLPPYDGQQILHASLQIGPAILMMCDDPFEPAREAARFSVNWAHPDEARVRQIWQRFVEAGASVEMPLEPSFFSSLFGSLTDRFGISWQIMLAEDMPEG